MSPIKYLDEIEIKGARVLIRADLNVPVDGNGRVTDESRIVACLDSIRYCLNRRCKVTVCSHRGRPKDAPDPKLSLLPAADTMARLLGIDMILADSPGGAAALQQSLALKPEQVLLLENLRFHPGEKKNDPAFAEMLAKFGEVYINDAFGVLHRAHASVVGVTGLAKKAVGGFLVKREVYKLGRLLADPERPYLTILGGAKVSDKIGLIYNLAEKVDTIMIGGAMAYTFLAAQGIPVGKSLVEQDKLGVAEEIIHQCRQLGVNVLFPVDHLVTPRIEDPGKVEVTRSADVPEGMIGVDIGPRTIELFCRHIARARTVFWNGPMGLFEVQAYSRGSVSVARRIAECMGYTVGGGGDTLAAIRQAGMMAWFTHLSTGGGAALEMLEGASLPGLLALGDAAQRMAPPATEEAALARSRPA
ncbi:MAG: phosphoglycerate kinase [Nitrospirae bacterium]|nr:phosphoglycerate kinase [Nitrospirota bacterium]